jgi:two-component system, NarL family, nitrate/nitrite response regulator NarL
MPGAAVGTPAEVVAAIVSPNRLLRDGVEAILEGKGFSVGLSVSHVKDFVRSLPRGDAPPEVLILVGALPSDSDEISALGSVRETAPNLRIIVFAEERADPVFLRRLISIGVDALLPTDLSAEILVQSIRLVLLGEGFMFTEYIRRLLEGELLLDVPMPDFTPRELKIICFMAEGQSNKTIAGWLNLTEASVKVQIRRLLRKLGATNRTQAAIWAVERGLVQADQIGATDTG